MIQTYGSFVSIKTLQQNHPAAPRFTQQSQTSPVYICVEDGILTMEVEGKESRQITGGQAIAEPLDSQMRMLNKSQQPAKLVVFQISPAAQAFLEGGKGSVEWPGYPVPAPCDPSGPGTTKSS